MVLHQHLDTLNELAAALGDDADFSSTMTTNPAGKVAKAGDTMSGRPKHGRQRCY